MREKERFITEPPCRTGDQPPTDLFPPRCSLKKEKIHLPIESIHIWTGLKLFPMHQTAKKRRFLSPSPFAGRAGIPGCPLFYLIIWRFAALDAGAVLKR
jgi:hypothetical protein